MCFQISHHHVNAELFGYKKIRLRYVLLEIFGVSLFFKHIFFTAGTCYFQGGGVIFMVFLTTGVTPLTTVFPEI